VSTSKSLLPSPAASDTRSLGAGSYILYGLSSVGSSILPPSPSTTDTVQPQASLASGNGTKHVKSSSTDSTHAKVTTTASTASLQTTRPITRSVVPSQRPLTNYTRPLNSSTSVLPGNATTTKGRNETLTTPTTSMSCYSVGTWGRSSKRPLATAAVPRNLTGNTSIDQCWMQWATYWNFQSTYAQPTTRSRKYGSPLAFKLSHKR
jgi:hypothetical protein